MRNHFLKVGRVKLGNASIVDSVSMLPSLNTIVFASDAISGAVAGDVAIVFCYKAADITIPIVSGWTRLYYAETGTSFGIYTKTLTDSDVSFTVAFGASNSGAAIMVLCRGVDGSAITGNHTLEASVLPNPPLVSGFAVNDMCLAFGAYKHSSVVDLMYQTSGYTLRMTRINTTTTKVSVVAESKKITTSGDDDPPTFTGGSAAESSRAVTLRLPSL